MKINTESGVMYAGDRNIQLAEQAKEPLQELSEADWLRLAPLSANERLEALHQDAAPVDSVSAPAPETVTVTVTREELDRLMEAEGLP